MGTSVIFVFEYLIGIFIFGLVYWLLDGILKDFMFISVQDSVYNFAIWSFNAAVIIYLIFGMFYLYRSIKTWRIT